MASMIVRTPTRDRRGALPFGAISPHSINYPLLATTEPTTSLKNSSTDREAPMIERWYEVE